MIRISFLRLDQIHLCVRQRTIISDRPRQHERHLVFHEGMHQSTLENSRGDGRLDGTLCADPIDCAHVMGVALLHGASIRNRNSEAGAVQLSLDVVDRQRISTEHGVDPAGVCELSQITRSAGVDHHGSRYPDHLLPRLARRPRQIGNTASLYLDPAFRRNLVGHEGKRLGFLPLLAGDQAHALVADQHRLSGDQIAQFGTGEYSTAVGDTGVHSLLL